MTGQPTNQQLLIKFNAVRLADLLRRAGREEDARTIEVMCGLTIIAGEPEEKHRE